MAPGFRSAFLAIASSCTLSWSQTSTSPKIAVELYMFSGRPRPKVEFSDSLKMAAIIQATQNILSTSVPIEEVPPHPSTPSYSGCIFYFLPTPLELSPALSQYKGLEVWNGYACGILASGKPSFCFIDSGRTLEKLAVSEALGMNDLNYPGGPQPMSYLKCSIPEELHPDSPCPTSLISNNILASKIRLESSEAQGHFVFSVNGRKIDGQNQSSGIRIKKAH